MCVFASESLCLFQGARSVYQAEFADQAALQGQSKNHPHRLPPTYQLTYIRCTHTNTLKANICTLSSKYVCSPLVYVSSNFIFDYRVSVIYNKMEADIYPFLVNLLYNTVSINYLYK